MATGRLQNSERHPDKEPGEIPVIDISSDHEDSDVVRRARGEDDGSGRSDPVPERGLEDTESPQSVGRETQLQPFTGVEVGSLQGRTGAIGGPLRKPRQGPHCETSVPTNEPPPVPTPDVQPLQRDRVPGTEKGGACGAWHALYHVDL